MTLKVYVALPMIHMKDFSFNKKFIKLLEDLGFEVLSKWVIKFEEENPREVFERDISTIEKCDILIADVTFPSHGVGMEIMYAFIKGKRIIVTAKKGSKISYMILGMPGVRVIYYNTLSDLEKELRDLLTHNEP